MAPLGVSGGSRSANSSSTIGLNVCTRLAIVDEPGFRLIAFSALAPVSLFETKILRSADLYVCVQPLGNRTQLNTLGIIRGHYRSYHYFCPNSHIAA